MRIRGEGKQWILSLTVAAGAAGAAVVPVFEGLAAIGGLIGRDSPPIPSWFTSWLLCGSL